MSEPLPVRPAPAIEYPSSDGQRMAENDWQLHAILDAVGALYLHFEHRPDVYVSGDLLIYYEEGNVGARVAPDVFVVFGAPKHKRMTYKLWEEPKAPDFVLEVASPRTWKQDRGPKRVLYERLGVREYWRYDPTGDHFTPRLQGLRLWGGEYRPLPAQWRDGTQVLHSDALGLDLRVEGELLRFRDPATGEDLRTYREEMAARRESEAARRESDAARRESDAARQESDAARQESEARLAREAAAREAAEAEVARLRALVRDLQGT